MMKKTIGCLLLALCVALACVPVSATTAENTMHIYGLYLTAAGDATLVESDGKWLLIDTGMASSAPELLDKLDAYGVREVDVLISHLHNDHTGGFEALANSAIKITRLFVPDAALSPDDPNTAKKHNQLRTAALKNNDAVEITPLKKSDTFAFGKVCATVLGPVSNVSIDDFTATAEQTALDIYVNCRSLTVRFDCGDASFLSAGDIELQEEQALVAAYTGTNLLDVDIMKLSHHALHTSNTKELLALITPRYSFAHNTDKTISAGSDYRMYYTSCKNASAYGPVYLIGDEKQDIHIVADGDVITLFKGTEELKGLVELTGGDGTVTKTYKYYITGHPVSEGVYVFDGKKYYLSEGGFVNKGYYSHLDDKYVYRYEPVKGGDVRYFDLEGVMYTGFHPIGNYYYYFDPDSGLLRKGMDADLEIVTIEGKKYALYPSGAIYNYGGETVKWKTFGDAYRCFGTDGVMMTGFIKSENYYFYFDPETGLSLKGDADKELTIVTIEGKKYALYPSGAVYNYGGETSKWREFGDSYRYFNTEGVMQTGWLTLGEKKYYLDLTTGLRYVGLKEIDGATYYFIESNNAAYAFCGGWKNIDGQYRYFDTDGKEVVSTGDGNNDGKVNNRDLGLLQQHLNEFDVEISLTAVDLDGNGRVNNRDLGMLQQRLNR